MPSFKSLIVITVILLTMTAGCSKPDSPEPTPLAGRIKRFAPTEITGDISMLSEGNRQAIPKLIAAARMMDSIYLRQVWSGNIELMHRLLADRSPAGQERYHYFRINMSPWSALDDQEPFVDGVPQRPPHANFYPDDMTKEEFEQWVATLPEKEQQNARGFFHAVRRDGNGRLFLRPYNEEYTQFLEPAARLLREAAGLTDNPSLKVYLTKRADAFLSNDYYDSDVAWMDLDSPIDVTIGPYEVYMDELFNYKAAFEAYITLRNDEETRKLEMFSGYLQEIEDNLPIDKKYRNPKLGALSPIRVVDEIYVGGEAKAGVQTAAFNLPNDERVTTEKGSKRVMLKNVQEAKFNKVLTPIARVAVDVSQQPLISFEPFFTHILAHELMHGLGPHSITIDGRKTTVRQEMKELSSALEEAKADISGLFALQYLIDKGVVDKETERPMYVTYLAGMFRSVRFGLGRAHGKGMALQCNYLTDMGAVEVNGQTGTFRVNFDKIKDGVESLTREIMTIQAEGNYTKAKELLDTYGVIRPPMQKILDQLTGIPVDIEPDYPLAAQIL